MKNSFLYPAMLGLLLMGCAPDNNRIQTASADSKSAADNSPTTKPANPASQKPTDPSLVTTTPAATSVPPMPAEDATTSAKTAVTADRLFAWRLRPEDYDDELTQTGRVTRSKTPASETTATPPMDNDALTSLITAKLLANSDIAALSLKVATNNGVVTLTGSAHSRDQIGRAMALVLDTPGVTQVVSLVTVSVS